MSKKEQHVAVGVLVNQQGEVLLAQRPIGKPWEGWWEFPGGKIEANENVEQALRRELQEELGILVTQSTPWVNFTHEYPNTIAHLYFHKVSAWQGEPQGLENQAFKWVRPEQAPLLGDILPASISPLKWLQLPDCYAITHIGTPSNIARYLDQFEHSLQQGIKLFQFREPSWQDGVGAHSLFTIFEHLLQRCRQANAKLLVNSVHPKAWAQQADGLHVRAIDAVRCDERPMPSDKLVGISCHHLADVLYSHILRADFIVLGHVEQTPSHPTSPPLGWAQFTTLAAEAGRPVYAIGGQSLQTLDHAKRHGAHGIAGIRMM